MQTIQTKTYDISIKSHSFNTVLDILEPFSVSTYHILVDKNVYGLYKEKILNAFSSSTYTITVIPSGEHSKSFAVCESTINTLMEKRVKRQDYLVAIGGGVVGDLTGFIASILFRGINYIQVPTTLLAMVDSSVGGKTAINIPKGKNLIGAFHAPKHVIIDPVFLTTLPEKERKSGLSEMLKAAIIGDATLLESLQHSSEINEELIGRAIKVKLHYVEQDYHDLGIRHVLNFGHTYGHAIEQFHNYNVTHGEAVAQGMLMALDLGVDLGITPVKIKNEISQLITSLQLITTSPVAKTNLLPFMENDKKSTDEGVRFVLLSGYQNPIIKTLTWDDLL